MYLLPLVLIVLAPVAVTKQYEVPLFEALSYYYNATPSLIAPLWVENLLGKQAIFPSKQQRDVTDINPITFCSIEILGMVSSDAPSRGSAKLYIDGVNSGDDNSWQCFYRTIKVIVNAGSMILIPLIPCLQLPKPKSNLNLTELDFILSPCHHDARKIGAEDNTMPCPSSCIAPNDNRSCVFLNNHWHPTSHHHQLLLLLLSMLSTTPHTPPHIKDAHIKVMLCITLASMGSSIHR